jgi:hypothetical protein
MSIGNNMKKICALIAISVFGLSCLQQPDSKKDIKVSVSSTRKDLSQKDSTTVTRTSPPTVDTLFFKLRMDNNNNHLIIPISVTHGKEIFATVSSSDEKANIRISQIGLPDSTFEGPFGQSLQYNIKIPGTYKIIIGENMMAGDPWTGDFILKVWIK